MTRLTDEQVADLLTASIFVRDKAQEMLAREVQEWRRKCDEVGVQHDPDMLVLHHRNNGKMIGAGQVVSELIRIDAELRALHRERHLQGFQTSWCNECARKWPCPTTRILDGGDA